MHFLSLKTFFFDVLFLLMRLSGLSQAGKKLLLITNSDYHYTNKMMQHAFNRFLPNDMGWRDLFEMVRQSLLGTFHFLLHQALTLINRLFVFYCINIFTCEFLINECCYFEGSSVCKEARIFSNVSTLI